MKHFRYNHFWFIPWVILQCLVLWYVSSEKSNIIGFYMGNGGGSSTAIISVLVVIIILYAVIYTPYRVISDPKISFKMDDEYLYIESGGNINKIKFGAMSDVLVKPKWTRFMGAPFIIFYVGSKQYKIQSGFYLSDEDYQFFKEKVVVKEQ